MSRKRRFVIVMPKRSLRFNVVDTQTGKVVCWSMVEKWAEDVAAIMNSVPLLYQPPPKRGKERLTR